MKSRFMKRIVIPIVTAIMLAYAAWGFGLINFEEAIILQNLGVSFVIFANIVWVILVDSAERWPNDNTLTRTLKIFTFSTK